MTNKEEDNMKPGLLLGVALSIGLFVPILSSTPRTQKEIALTFDDEIRPVLFSGTDGIRSILDANKAPATFFVLGAQVRSSPEIFKELVSDGHEIENHTWGHDNLLKLKKQKGMDAVLSTVERAATAIEHAVGRRPRFFRPPYWAIDREIKDALRAQGYRVMTIDDPDVNSADYDDSAHHRPASVLVGRVLKEIRARESRGLHRHVLVFHETRQTAQALREILPELRRQGYGFVTLEKFFEHQPIVSRSGIAHAAEIPLRQEIPVRALYLSVDDITNKNKIAAISDIISITDANALVIDYKVDRPVPDTIMRGLVEHFKKMNVYLIARVAVMQDSYLARTRPSIALHRRDGSFWWSGRKKWNRYWVDPASPQVLAYTIDVAKHAIDLGFDEINFDYIRFPTDGALSEIVYPVFDAKTMNKSEVMDHFFRELTQTLRTYDARVKLSIDLFGEVAAYGQEKGIGQGLLSAAKYFDVLCPMAYPSHYRCGEFKFHDPTAHPYEVYRQTLLPAKKFLEDSGAIATLRPWVQAFSLRSIYGCGPHISYGPSEVRAEIQGGIDVGVPFFMLWNAGSRYSSGYFLPKK